MMSSDSEVSLSFGLELVADDFTDEEHRILDGKLSMWMAPDSSGDIAVLAPYLLHLLAEQLGERTSKKCKSVEYCKKLVEENPVLIDMLVKCAPQGFKSVRCLKILRNESVPVTLRESRNTGPLINITRAATLAWDLEYQGQYAQILRDNINNLPRAVTHPNYITIVQSSGYGKSRMVDELAKFVFTIPLNIRMPGEHTLYGAYPPSDPKVWEYLCTVNTYKVDVAERVVSSFFGNLFMHVANEVQGTFHRMDRVSQDTFAREWREHLSKPAPNTFDTYRSQLYKNVVLASAEACEQNLESLKQAVTMNLAHLLDVLSRLCSYPPSDKDGNNCVQIILYFDEAHELDQDIGGEKTFYDVIWSILAEFEDERVFTIFLSTQSSMNVLTPSRKLRSSRQQNVEALWGPVTETPFDCHPTFPLQPGQYGLAEVSQLSFMMRFGRPLFWTMFERKEYINEEPLLADMMNLARSKLLFEGNIHREAGAVNRNGRIAILDVLITIDYEPRRESARQFEMELVASHMRTAFSIPCDRMYLHSGYPSEPFLAEAASRQMHHFTQAAYSICMAAELYGKVKEGVVDLNRKDEVVMRLLLRKAYMDAIVGEQGAENPNFSLGCSFVKFLGALLAEPHDASVRNCKPDNIAVSSSDTAVTDLAVVFKDAIVRFTHFAKVVDEAAMTTRGMVMGFLRGAALIGWNSRKSVDIAIPILMNKDDKIEEASMSALLIRVKRRYQRGSVDAYIIDATKIDFFTEDAVEHPKPYVTLIAELRARVPATLEANVKFGEPRRCISPRRLGEEPHPRYSIWAYQCTSKTWKVIDYDQFYEKILESDDRFGEHPSQDDASLDLVNRMLPFWDPEPSWFSAESDVAMEPVPGESGPTKLGELMEM